MIKNPDAKAFTKADIEKERNISMVMGLVAGWFCGVVSVWIVF